MKKAKVILTALTVFAVVGGALAFKAANFTGTLYCASSSGNACDKTTGGVLITYKATSTGTAKFCTNATDGDACSGITTSTKVVADN